MPRDVQLFSVTEKHNKNLWKLLLGQLFICAAPSVFISMGANRPTPDAPKKSALWTLAIPDQSWPWASLFWTFIAPLYLSTLLA